MKFSGANREAFLDSLQDIELNLSMIQMLIDGDRGSKAIENVNKFKKDRAESRSVDKKDNEGLPKSSLSDEDKELLEFMYEQPDVIEETNEMKSVGKFILPTVDISKTKVVKKSKKRPKLGLGK